MAVRRFWRRIDLRWVNLVLVVLAAWITLAWWDELRWSAGELPRYLQGSIGSPEERKLYRAARKLILAGGDLERARELLERSIAIDPNSDAVYWLAECRLAAGDPDGALEQFERFIDFDPTRADAYLGAASILESRGQAERARELLRRGLDYFESYRESLTPRPDPAVPMKYNRKAIGVYEYYGSSISRLRQELRRLDPPPEG